MLLRYRMLAMEGGSVCWGRGGGSGHGILKVGPHADENDTYADEALMAEAPYPGSTRMLGQLYCICCLGYGGGGGRVWLAAVGCPICCGASYVARAFMLAGLVCRAGFVCWRASYAGGPRMLAGLVCWRPSYAGGPRMLADGNTRRARMRRSAPYAEGRIC
jgi:hypothetical protein